MANIYVSSAAYVGVAPWGGGRNLVANTGGAFSNFSGATITAGQTDPRGGTQASLIAEQAVNSGHFVTCPTFTVVSGQQYAIGIRAKKNTHDKIQLYVTGAFTTVYANFDLTNGTFVGGGQGAGMLDEGNGWFLCWIVAAPGSSGAGQALIVGSINALTDGAFAGFLGSTSRSFFVSDPSADLGCTPTRPFVATSGTAVEPTGSEVRSVGDLRRSTSATMFAERVYRCTTAGTSGASEPVWNIRVGGTTTDGTAVWTEVTGQEAYGWNAPHARIVPVFTSGLVYQSTVGVLSAGGTGYTVGDVLTATGGTILGEAMKVRVDAVSAGAVTAFSLLSGGGYTVNVAATVGVTGGTGTGFTFTRGANAQYNWVAAGDTIYLSDDHSESQASAMTLTAPGTYTSPNRVLCVDRAGSVPPVSADLSTGASIETTGNSAITMNTAAVYFHGIAFTAGSGAVAAALSFTGFFKKCALRKRGTSAAAAAIFWGTTSAGASNKTVFDETTVEFGATGDGLRSAIGWFEWRNTPNAIQGAVLPTTLFSNTNEAGGADLFEGVDFSALGSGKTLFPANSLARRRVLKDCKLGSGVTILSGTQAGPSANRVHVVNCDSADTNYRNEFHAYEGSDTTETVIVRSGGASDGTTPISRKLVTTANPEWFYPLEAMPLTVWNETVGAPVTITVEGVWDAAAVPNNDDIWMDVEYLGTSGFPIGSLATDGKADILATGTAQDSSTETWTTTGLTTPTKFKLVKQITPQEKGPITVYIKAARVSSTFYIDPKITVS